MQAPIGLLELADLAITLNAFVDYSTTLADLVIGTGGLHTRIHNHVYDNIVARRASSHLPCVMRGRVLQFNFLSRPSRVKFSVAQCQILLHREANRAECCRENICVRPGGHQIR